MAAMRVIPALNEFKDCHAGFDLSFEVMAIEQFAFEGGKEAFAHGVVETIADRTHRRPHASLLTALAKGQRSILAALIGVMNHGGGPALAKRHVERLKNQFGTQMGGHGPADNTPAEGVEHHRQVEKARPGRDVSNVGHPYGVGRRANEMAMEQIRPGRAPGSRTVVTIQARRLAPRRPAAFIKRATRLRPRWISAARNSS